MWSIHVAAHIEGLQQQLASPSVKVHLHEKGSKLHEMPCHHNLDDFLHA
ncbi:MAG TPA: hypothetical protein VLU73_15480 [Methylococcaceae bacterium]|nr:hypothetical protein [Methylococcaceae bacterium]